MADNHIFALNYVADRQRREVEKYGPRLPVPQLAAHAHIYLQHSIEPAYGKFDRPVNDAY
jgi:hypothetical protein